MPQDNPFAYLFPPYSSAVTPDLASLLGIAPPSVAPPSTNGAMTPDLIREGLSAFRTQDEPVKAVEPEKIKTGKRLALALADAVAAYGAAMARMPQQPSFLGQLRQRREQEAQRKTEELRGEQGRKRQERLAEARAKIEVGLQENRRADAARVRAEAGLQRLNEKHMAEEERRISEANKATEKLRERTTILEELKKRGLSVTPEFEAAYLATGDFPPGAGKQGEAESYAGFKTLQQLSSAVEQAARAEMQSSMIPDIVEIPNPGDPFNPVKRQVVPRPSITRAEALRRAMKRYPGSEQFLPMPEEPTDPAGLTLEDVQRKLRERQPQR